MDELSTLNRLGESLDPPSEGPPPALRTRVLAALEQPVSGRPARVRWVRARPARLGSASRLGWRLGAAAGLAAAVTAGVFALQTTPSGGHRPAANAEAAEILNYAAATAGGAPAPAVRPNQFVFVESMTAYPSYVPGVADPGPRPADRKLRQIWLSVDGTGDGVLKERPSDGTGRWRISPLPGCRDGQSTAVKGNVTETQGSVTVTQKCEATPAYHGDLPSDPAAMLTYLYRNSNGGNPADQQAFITVGDLIRENYLPPRSLSALFAATAKIPGVTVTRSVVDADGRTGIAVGRTFNGSRQELIFDPHSYAYLGERELDGHGSVTGEAARLRIAIVDRAGLLP